ncbi:hypothetical protein COOONC_06400, partial [Cooperia oncophora]
MYICRWKIYSLLKSGAFSTNTKRTAKELVTALTLQSAVPVLAIFPAAVLYVLVQFGKVTSIQTISSYLIVPCLCI